MLNLAPQVRRIDNAPKQPLSVSLASTPELFLEASPVRAMYRQKQFEELKNDRSEVLATDYVQSEFGKLGITNVAVPEQGLSRSAFDYLVTEKERENTAKYYASSSTGIAASLAKFGVGVGSMVLDPVMTASMFIPVAGVVKAGQITKVMTTAQRVKAASIAGAVEGAVGSAVVEPLVYNPLRATGYDYTLEDSAFNIAAGTVFGAGLQGVVRLAGDVIGGHSKVREYELNIESTYNSNIDLVKQAIEDRRKFISVERKRKESEAIAQRTAEEAEQIRLAGEKDRALIDEVASELRAEGDAINARRAEWEEAQKIKQIHALSSRNKDELFAIAVEQAAQGKAIDIDAPLKAALKADKGVQYLEALRLNEAEVSVLRDKALDDAIKGVGITSKTAIKNLKKAFKENDAEAIRKASKDSIKAEKLTKDFADIRERVTKFDFESKVNEEIEARIAEIEKSAMDKAEKQRAKEEMEWLRKSFREEAKQTEVKARMEEVALKAPTEQQKQVTIEKALIETKESWMPKEESPAFVRPIDDELKEAMDELETISADFEERFANYDDEAGLSAVRDEVRQALKDGDDLEAAIMEAGFCGRRA